MDEDDLKISKALEKVGIYIEDIYELVNTNKSYPEAIPVLIELIKEDFNYIKVKEGIIRALAVKEAKGIAVPFLIEEYNRISKENEGYRWAIGNTVSVTFNSENVESILNIILNKTNGTSRQMFVYCLGNTKSEKVEDTLISLLDDDEVVNHALYALGKMKSRKSIYKISSLLNHHNAFTKKKAEKILRKMGYYNK
jgi:hypothetical protein